MKRELVVGLVFSVLVATLLGVTIWVNDPHMLRKAPFRMTARFPEVSGLTAGSDVWVYGTKAGRVASIERDASDAGFVLVVLDLDYDPRMREDGTVRIRPSSPLGGSIVAILPGPAGSPLAATSVFDGELAEGPFEEVSRTARKLETELTVTLAKVNTALDAINRGDGVLGRLIHDPELGADIKTTVSELRRAASSLNDPSTAAGKFLSPDSELSRQIEGIVRNVSGAAERLADGRSPLGRLLDPDSEFGRRFDEITSNLADASAKLRSTDTTLGMLLNDETFASNLRQASADIAAASARLNDKNTTIGMLFADDRIGRRLDKVTDDLAAITNEIRTGNGTLHNLVYDPALYADLKSTLKKLAGGVEDARENAPILTFAGFLFAGF